MFSIYSFDDLYVVYEAETHSHICTIMDDLSRSGNWTRDRLLLDQFEIDCLEADIERAEFNHGYYRRVEVLFVFCGEYRDYILCVTRDEETNIFEFSPEEIANYYFGSTIGTEIYVEPQNAWFVGALR